MDDCTVQQRTRALAAGQKGERKHAHSLDMKLGVNHSYWIESERREKKKSLFRCHITGYFCSLFIKGVGLDSYKNI